MAGRTTISRSPAGELGDRRVEVAVDPLVPHHGDHLVRELLRLLADLGDEKVALGDLEPLAVRQQVLHHRAERRGQRREAEQPSDGVGGRDHGVGAGLLHQRGVLVLARRRDDVDVGVELADGERGEHVGVVPIGGDDDLVGLGDPRPAQHLAAGGVTRHDRQAVRVRILERGRARVDDDDRLPVPAVADQGLDRAATLGAVADDDDVTSHFLLQRETRICSRPWDASTSRVVPISSTRKAMRAGVMMNALISRAWSSTGAMSP